MSAAPSGRACAEEIGALDYLPKPFDFETLLAAIERAGRAQLALSR
jgi:DNA-binding response OmpR family regulator